MTLELPSNDPFAIALTSAIQHGEIAVLRRLFAANPALATARIVDARGARRTLLHVVADWPGHFPDAALTAVVLIKAGADVNATMPHPTEPGVAETPLHWAASSDDVELIDALLDNGADLEASGAVFTGGSPMSDAVVFAQWNAARRLLERGAKTTIWQAAALGQLERVQRLSDQATPAEITNALWNACRGGQLAVVQYLLERGADRNWIGYQGKTPLDAAQDSGAEDLIQWLRDHGASATK
jgi:uncharacterized protein